MTKTPNINGTEVGSAQTPSTPTSGIPVDEPRGEVAANEIISEAPSMEEMRSSIHADSSNNAGKLINLLAAPSHYLCGGFKRTHGMEKQHKSDVVAVESVEQPHLIPGLKSLPSQHFFHFESRKLIYKQLLEALECNYMTGLYGIEGVGKTTLATEVIVKLHDSIKFDHVIFITMSKISHMKEIQDIIADKLGLSLEGNNEWERRATIMERLKNGERILLIFDDVMKNINTKELGIPSRHNNMNCRVLVTSRDEGYCKSIGCQRSIQLDKLSKRDTWKSFKKHAGIKDDSSPEVQRVGKLIAMECEGLPHIVGIASILKVRPHLVWRGTLEYLRRGFRNYKVWNKACAFVNFHDDDNLNITKAQRLYNLLSIFPREVPIEMLTRLSMGMGLFDEFKKYSEVRSEVLKLKDILVDSHVCFEDEGGNVKKDLDFRDMYQLTEFELFRIEKKFNYLHYNNLPVKNMESGLIPNSGEYDGTKIEMLIINVEANNSVEVWDAIFEKMTKLQLLSLSSNNLHPTHALKLPPSHRSLTNIRSLLLSHWKLGDISILGKLQSLHTLDFDDCSMKEFPKEMSTLKLRLLSLKKCQIEMNNPFEVIERCLSLQELYYKDNELSNLHSVNNEAEEIYQSETFDGLNRYHLQGGGDDSKSKCVCLPRFDALVSEATFEYLIQGAEILHLKEIREKWRNLIPGIVSSMDDVVELRVESCLHLQGTLFNSKVNLCNLKSVNLFDCPELTSLFQLSTAQSLVLLEELRIGKCKSLKDIIEDGNDRKSKGLIFPKLETLEIEGSSNLFSISIECYPHSPSTVKKSSRRIDIKEKQQDPSIKIPMESGLEEGPMSSISLIVGKIKQLVLKDLDKIKYLFTLSIASSMKLEVLIVDSCHALKHIIDIGENRDGKNFNVFRELKELSVSNCHHLECMFGEDVGPNDQNYTEIHIHLPALKKLNLQKLPNFSLSSMTWTSLKEFVLVQCPEFIINNPISDMMIHLDSRKLVSTTIKDIREIDQHFLTLETLNINTESYRAESIFCLKGHEIIGQVRLGLQSLNLSNLSQMLRICEEGSVNSTFVFPNLKTIQIVGCHYLRVIFPVSSLSYLPMLEDLKIQNCRNLVQIIGEDKKMENVDSPHPSKMENVDSPHPSFPKLKVLVVEECINLKSLIPAYDVPNVEEIRIRSCNELEVIFPGSVLSCLPELEVLNIQHCEELRQIIEKEDKKLGNVDSPQPCFPKLAKLMVIQCYNLNRLIHASNDVPNLELLIIIKAEELEELMGGGEQRKGDDVSIGKIKVELPKLKLLIFCEVPEATFKEVIGLQTVLHRLVIGCPKLSLESTATFKEIEKKVLELFHIDLKTLLGKGLHRDMVQIESVEAQKKSVSDLDSSQNEIRLDQSETHTDKENEGDSMNTQDFKDDDLNILFQYVGEDGDGEIPQPSVAVITEDNMVVDILADLEKSLKMPLKDIASFEANALHCLKVLNFLSDLPLEDETLSDGLKAIIESLHQEFLNILHSFMKAFAIIENFAVLEENEKSIKEELAHQNGIAISLVSKISKAENNMEEAQQKKATLKEQIIDLEKEIQDLHCLKEKKDQSIQEGSEIENTIIKRHVEEGTTSNNAKVETSLTPADSVSSQFGTSVTSQPKPNLQSEIELKQVFVDLEESLKMPLNDIASSEGNSSRFLKALNLLSHLPLEDITQYDGCKAIIDSLRHEFPSILCSFKQAFAITNKFAVLRPRLNEVTTMLVSKISKAKNFMGESQQKEETLKEEIIRLEKANTDVSVGPKAQTKSRVDLPSSQISEESKMELVGKVPDSEIPATTTSPTDLKWIERPSFSLLDNTLHKTQLDELVDGRRMNESCLINQQKSLGETECTTEIPQCFQKPEHQSIQECSKSEKIVTTGSSYSKTRSTLAAPSLVPFQMGIERGVEEGTTSDDAKILTLSTISKIASSQSGPLVIADSKSNPHREIKLNQNEISTDKDSEGQIHTPSVSDVIADNSLVKIFADLEESLKMPLKDIACTEANNNPLLVGLSFLSHLPLEDATPSDALEVIIVSMHKELPTILFSFKQVFDTINKVAVLKPHLNEVATKLVSRISKTKNCIDEARKKKETLKEHIILLEKEIKHCEDGLSSLQEEKKKCIAETIGYKKEYENVKKDKSKMLEDQQKARKELFEVDYRWSDLRSQFLLNRFVTRNPI